MTGSRRYLMLGSLTGLSVWVRPDGLTLLGPLLFVAWMTEKTWHLRGQAIWKTLIGFGSLVLPYVFFNLALSGNAMPNTFYAKQAEYGLFWHSKPVLERVSEYLWPILASPFLALTPAALYWLRKRIIEQHWGAIAGLLWVIGYISIYFASLPAYQHGRYIIPALPVLYLWGILGFLDYVFSERANKRIVFVWQVVTLALCLAFALVGAQQNASDVSWIESEMVETARWVNQNVPADSRLAVHDIGALGYYVQNPIVDLAGLITPEVVPFIRDESRLAEYLDSNSVEYLITLPSFYPQLTANRELIFRAGSELSELGENMGVYRWR
jgi:hypothetical protein